MPTGERASARLQARAANDLAGRLLADMQKSKAGNARWSTSALLTMFAATPVHVVTLALGALGVALQFPHTPLIDRLAGLLCLGAAVAFRPRFTPSPTSTLLQTSPAVRSLIADVAQSVGAPMPTHLVVDSRFNAGARRTGLRGRTLTLGAPLWAALGPAERVALLAHEMGHFANGDIAQTRYVNAALVTLHHWGRVFAMDVGVQPLAYHRTRRSGAGFGFIAKVMFWPARALLSGYSRLIGLLGAATSRRQEHYADLASVAVAGTDAATRSLEVLMRYGAAETTATRALLQRLDVFDEIAAQFRAHSSDSPDVGRHLLGAETNRIDASHPPTLHRIALVQSYPGITGAVSLDASGWAEIDRELSKPMHSAAKAYAERIVHRT